MNQNNNFQQGPDGQRRPPRGHQVVHTQAWRRSADEYLSEGMVVTAALAALTDDWQPGIGRRIEAAWPNDPLALWGLASEILGHRASDLTELADSVSPQGWADHGLPADTLDEDGAPTGLSRRSRFRLGVLTDAALDTNPGWHAEIAAKFVYPSEEGDGDDFEEISLPQPAEPDEALGGPDLIRLGELPDGFMPLDLLSDLPLAPREWICGNFLERWRVTLLSAVPGGSKTTCGTHIALAVAAGQDWAGFAVARSGRVLTVQAEENRDETMRRFKAAAVQDGIGHESLANVFLWVGRGGMRIMGKGAEGPVLTDAGHRLRAAIAAIGPDLVVLDTLASSQSLDEQSNGEMSQFFGTLADWAGEYRCAILVTHHERKQAPRGDNPMDAVRGASSIVASVRTIYQLRPRWSGEAAGGESGAEDMVELRCVKSNNSARAAGPIMLRRGAVTLANGDQVGVLISDCQN